MLGREHTVLQPLQALKLRKHQITMQDYQNVCAGHPSTKEAAAPARAAAVGCVFAAVSAARFADSAASFRPCRHQFKNPSQTASMICELCAAEHRKKRFPHLRHALRNLRQRPRAKFPDISNSAAQLLPH